MTFEEANNSLKSYGKAYWDALEAFGVNRNIDDICINCKHMMECLYYDKRGEGDPEYIVECNFYEE